MRAFVIFVGVIWGAVGAVFGEVRTWTDSTGTHTRKAEFVGLKGGIVRLREVSGETIDLPLEKLSAADQKVAEKLEQPKRKPEKARQPQQRRKQPSQLKKQRLSQ